MLEWAPALQLRVEKEQEYDFLSINFCTSVLQFCQCYDNFNSFKVGIQEKKLTLKFLTLQGSPGDIALKTYLYFYATGVVKEAYLQESYLDLSNDFLLLKSVPCFKAES